VASADPALIAETTPGTDPWAVAGTTTGDGTMTGTAADRPDTMTAVAAGTTTATMTAIMIGGVAAALAGVAAAAVVVAVDQAVRADRWTEADQWEAGRWAEDLCPRHGQEETIRALTTTGTMDHVARRAVTIGTVPTTAGDLVDHPWVGTDPTTGRQAHPTLAAVTRAADSEVHRRRHLPQGAEADLAAISAEWDRVGAAVRGLRLRCHRHHGRRCRSGRRRVAAGAR